jgi:hypothetical protein
MNVNGPDAQELERRRLKRLVVSIASIEVDWMVGLINSQTAMSQISTLLEKSRHDKE